MSSRVFDKAMIVTMLIILFMLATTVITYGAPPEIVEVRELHNSIDLNAIAIISFLIIDVIILIKCTRG